MLSRSAALAGATAVVLYYALRFLRADCDLAVGGRRLPRAAFAGQVVLVTGASAGIGAELARQFARSGARVIIAARRAAELDRVKGEIEAATPGAEVRTLVLDVADTAAVPAKMAEALAMFGRVDVLCNNAGISTRCLAAEADLEVYRRVMEVNFFGLVAVTRALLPQFVERGTGVIMNTSSIAGKMGSPLRSAYSGSKFAVQGYAECLRAELINTKVKVVNICPGPVESDIALSSLGKDGRPHGQRGGFHAKSAKVMPTSRCAHLMLVAAWHGLDEAWISDHPYLAFCYVNQFAPWLVRLVGPPVIRKMLAEHTQEQQQ